MCRIDTKNHIIWAARKCEQNKYFCHKFGLPFIAFGLVPFLAACGVQPVGPDEMAQQIATKLGETAVSTSEVSRNAVNLEAGFGPAILQAVEADEGYRAALARQVEAFSNIGVASSVRRPQLSSNAMIGGVWETGGTQPNKTSRGVTGGVNISQIIYDGGQSAAAVNQATAEALLIEAERKIRSNEIALEAANAWIDVWQFGERLRLLRSRSSEVHSMIVQMERMADNGFVDRLALDGAKRKIIDIKMEETNLQADLGEAEVRFVRFFHYLPSRLAAPHGLVTPSQARVAASEWQQSPRLERSAYELLIARSAVVSAEAAFSPRARLQAGFSSPVDNSESSSTSVGLVLEYQFSDGGRRKSQLASANASVEAAEAQLTVAQDILRSKLDVALDRLEAIGKSMPLVDEQVRLSALEVETLRSQLSTGQSNLRQLVEAEIENYRARDRQIEMQASQEILLLNILALTGSLSREIGLEVEIAR